MSVVGRRRKGAVQHWEQQVSVLQLNNCWSDTRHVKRVIRLDPTQIVDPVTRFQLCLRSPWRLCTMLRTRDAWRHLWRSAESSRGGGGSGSTVTSRRPEFGYVRFTARPCGDQYWVFGGDHSSFLFHLYARGRHCCYAARATR